MALYAQSEVAPPQSDAWAVGAVDQSSVAGWLLQSSAGKKWHQKMILLCRFDFSDLPENTSLVLTVVVAVTKVNQLNSLSFNLSALHVKIFIQRQLTCRELLDGHRWYWYTLRPIGYLRLGEFSSCRCAPFTLEFFLSNCLFSCSLFLLFNLFSGKTI